MSGTSGANGMLAAGMKAPARWIVWSLVSTPIVLVAPVVGVRVLSYVIAVGGDADFGMSVTKGPLLRSGLQEWVAMYAIAYTMLSGDTVHRARSARAAVQMLALIAESGGRIESIFDTRTGKKISSNELRRLAEDEMLDE